MAGFQAISSANTMKAGKAQANALVEEGRLNAENKAHQTVRAAGKLTTSFLQSGITLAGGPMEVISRAFTAGSADIDRIVSNANAGAKNAINSARSKALEGLTKTIAGAAGGVASGLSDAFNSDPFNSNTFGGFDPGEYGPYQPLPWQGQA